MMVIPISGPSYISGDNMSIVHITSKPESVNRKKGTSVCYHVVYESVAMGVPCWIYTQQRKCHRPNDKSPLCANEKVFGQ